VLKNLGKIILEKRSSMSDTKHWEKSSRNKRWQDRDADEKAEWVKAELQRMRSLFAMLSAQVQEIGRSVQAIRNTINENR
jgi:hypothetical protein